MRALRFPCGRRPDLKRPSQDNAVIQQQTSPDPPETPAQAHRAARLSAWAAGQLGASDIVLRPASSDASFRRYWRVEHRDASWILMDAPPEFEDCGRFADLSVRFRAIGLSTPEVFAEHREEGFLLLSDFGDRVYLGALREETVERLYGDALAALMTLQACGPLDGLPEYDAAFLGRELALFRDWCLRGLLSLELSGEETAELAAVEACLVRSALEQPRVCVHRDYHSRNLMLIARGNPGILDFQDAVVGPVTYDLVSLLRDCYVAWPEERVTDWALGYLQLARQSGVVREVEPAQWLRWFDLMGVQRHLKACGIFARLHLRDAKPHYLADIPRTLAYVLRVTQHHADLLPLGRLLRERVLPELDKVLPSPASTRSDPGD